MLRRAVRGGVRTRVGADRMRAAGRARAAGRGGGGGDGGRVRVAEHSRGVCAGRVGSGGGGAGATCGGGRWGRGGGGRGGVPSIVGTSAAAARVCRWRRARSCRRRQRGAALPFPRRRHLSPTAAAPPADWRRHAPVAEPSDTKFRIRRPLTPFPLPSPPATPDKLPRRAMPRRAPAGIKAAPAHPAPTARTTSRLNPHLPP